MLDQLRRQRDIIALEAVSGDDALAQATGRLPKFGQAIADLFKKYVLKPIAELMPRNELMAFARRTAVKPYNKLADLKIVGAPGQDTDFLTLLGALEEGVLAMNLLSRDVLGPFSSWLSNKLANPSSLASLTDSLNIAGYKPQDTEALEKKIAACFLPHQERQEMEIRYGDAIRRNADWPLIADKIGAINTALQGEQHKTIKKQAESISELLSQLVKRVEEEGEEYKVSPTTLKALAGVSYDIAQELEFYGVLCYRIDMVNTALEGTVKKVDEFKETA